MYTKFGITSDIPAGKYTESSDLDRWQDILRVLRRYTTLVSFDTWLSSLELISIDDDTRLLMLKANNDFVCRVVKERYPEILQEAVKAVLGVEYRITLKS